MNEVKNVSAGKPKISGAVFVAPTNATLPTTVSETLAEAFKCLGYISDAGITNDMTRESTDVKAWGGDTVLTVQTGKNDTWTFSMIETTNVDVLKQTFGEGNVAVNDDGSYTVKVNSQELTAHAWVFDMILRDGGLKRSVLPSATVVNTDAVTYSDSAAIGFNTTLKAMPDVAGNTHYEYIKKAE